MPAPLVVVGARGFIGGAVLKALRGNALGVSSADLSTVGSAREVIWLSGTANPRSPEPNDDVQAVAHALRLRERLWPHARFTLVSSGGTVYSASSSPPYTEMSPVSPDSAYAHSRLAMEAELNANRKSGDTIVRVSTVYGPGRSAAHSQGVITQWLNDVLHERQTKWLDHPDSCRDYIHIDDVASAFMVLSGLKDRPALVNVGSGQPTSLTQIADLVGTLTGHACAESTTRGLPVTVSWLDISRARSLGWQPEIALSEGVARMWDQLTDISAMNPNTALAMS